MSKSDVEVLKTAIRNRWPGKPSDKAKRYVGTFFKPIRVGTKIIAQVEGNYGTYTVSIQVEEQGLSSACSCYIGGDGYCHHCEALAITFLNDVSAFKEVKPKRIEELQSLEDVRKYLKGITLDSLLKELRANGITQKAFAESIGMSTRHLSSVKSCELRHRYYHELGATKLACLWVLERFEKSETARG